MILSEPHKWTPSTLVFLNHFSLSFLLLYLSIWPCSCCSNSFLLFPNCLVVRKSCTAPKLHPTLHNYFFLCHPTSLLKGIKSHFTSLYPLQFEYQTHHASPTQPYNFDIPLIKLLTLIPKPHPPWLQTLALFLNTGTCDRRMAQHMSWSHH